MTLEEVNARILDLQTKIEALEFMRDIHYLAAEGFLEIDGERLYPAGDAWCPKNL